MGRTEYLPRFDGFFYGINVGKYSIRPMGIRHEFNLARQVELSEKPQVESSESAMLLEVHNLATKKSSYFPLC